VFDEDGKPKFYRDGKPGDARRVCQIMRRTTGNGKPYLRVNIYNEKTGEFKFCIHCWECLENYKAALTRQKIKDVPDFEGKRKDITSNQQNN